MKIILITGVIGSGKDYLAKQYIKDHPQERVKVLKFAQSLRDVTEGMHNLPKGDDAAYEAFKAIPENREFMVVLGQNLKRVYGENFFAIKVAQDIERLQYDYDTFIVTDFRCPIEFWTLTKICTDIEVMFADYHSYRYTLIPEQETEKMAIWLKEKGFKDRQVFTEYEFMCILVGYELLI